MIEPVRVRWLDSLNWLSWKTLDAYARLLTPAALEHESVGYLIHEDEQSVGLALSRSFSAVPMVAQVVQIPRCALLGVEVFEVCRAREPEAASTRKGTGS